MASVRVLMQEAALFNAGMAAQYPALKTLLTFARADRTLPKARREHLLQVFLQRFEGMPKSGEAPDTETLSKVWRDAKPSSREVRTKRALEWCGALVLEYSDEADHLFLRRCAALFFELYAAARRSQWGSES